MPVHHLIIPSIIRLLEVSHVGGSGCILQLILSGGSEVLFGKGIGFNGSRTSSDDVLGLAFFKILFVDEVALIIFIGVLEDRGRIVTTEGGMVTGFVRRTFVLKDGYYWKIRIR